MGVHVTACASGSMVMSVLGAWGLRDAELRSHLSVLRGRVSPQRCRSDRCHGLWLRVTGGAGQALQPTTPGKLAFCWRSEELSLVVADLLTQGSIRGWRLRGLWKEGDVWKGHPPASASSRGLAWAPEASSRSSWEEVPGRGKQVPHLYPNAPRGSMTASTSVCPSKCVPSGV